MSLLLLFGGAGVSTPVPVLMTHTTGAQSSTTTSGGINTLKTTGGQPSLQTKGPTA